MAMDTTKVVLPRSVATYIKDNTKGHSTIAALSPAQPQLFADADHLVFDGASEAEVVGEGQVKSSYEQPVTNLVGRRFKVQTTTRVTNELQWADEDNQLEIIQAIQADQVAALGRVLDYVVYHAFNPKPKAELEGFAKLSEAAVQVTASNDPVADVDKLTDALVNYDVNGIALSKTWASALRKVRVESGQRLYPEIPINLQAGTFEGIAASTSPTVNGSLIDPPTGVLAFMGDFSKVRWGFVRDITAEVIPYGDPDQTGVDLKAHNQVAYRTEATYAYAVIDPAAFAVLKAPAQTGKSTK